MSTRRARVVVAYATVKLLDPISGKPAVAGFYQGAIFPPEADPENVASLVRREYAEWVDEPEPDAPTSEPEPESETPPSGDAPTDRPAQAAPKGDWVAYAVSQRPEGMSEDDARASAEARTKAELIAEYGG
jgi:hypothetical protein